MSVQQSTPLQQSKLAKDPNQQQLIKNLEDLWAKAHKLKAKEGAKRLEHVCNHYDRLTAETMYRWIDPVGFQHEVEDALSHGVTPWHIVRNCVSVLPLIVTWVSLLLALIAYPQDTFAGDATKSFLLLWAEGFHGGTFLRFSLTAGIDAALLSLFLIFIFITSALDGRAYSSSTRFAQTLQKATEDLMAVAASSHVISTDQDAIKNVAEAVQLVVKEAMKANQKIVKETMEANKLAVESADKSFKHFIETSFEKLTEVTQTSKENVNQIVQLSKEAIEASNDRADKLFTRTNSTLGTFEVNVNKLQTVLTNYQLHLDDLQTAIQNLTNASGTLTTYSNDYLQVGKKINENIDKLTQAHNNVLLQMKVISSGVSNAAGDMNRSASNLQNATSAVEKVANQLDSGIKTTLDAMTSKVKTTMDNMVTDISKATNNMNTGVQQTVQIMGTGVQQAAGEIRDQVDQAVKALWDLTPSLEATVASLDKASENLSKVASTNFSVGVNGSGGMGTSQTPNPKPRGRFSKWFPVGGILGRILRK